MGIEYNMDLGWRFHRGDLPEDDRRAKGKFHSAVYMNCKSGTAGSGAKKEYDDSDWREVDLPHDYFTESEMSEEYLLSGGYRKPDNAWYRKTFTLSSDLKGKALTLCFEGTAVNAEFYFNGSLMARSFSAYTETIFDITDRAYFDGRPNVLAVHIDGFVKEGWWYEGAGIYRHVKLYATDLLHIDHNGIFVKPVLINDTEDYWKVELETTLFNRSYKSENAKVRVILSDGEKLIATSNSNVSSVPICASKVFKQELYVARPIRWDVDNPKLYRVRVEVLKDDEIVDSDIVRIGFRTFYIDANKGFFLNGRPLKIKGTCNHQDHAGVGVAVPDTLQYYRIQRLKEMGTNAYRSAHNLPAKEILDACDELGLIVMDENRRFETRDEVLEYLRIMVRRDRNHPSVLFYSLFNEEPLQTTKEGARIFKHMKNVVHQLDDTRLITGCINSWEPYDGAGEEMDVIGLNYGLFDVANIIEKTHKIRPDKPIIGSENNSALTTRGCYHTDKEVAHVMNCYDEEKVSWGSTVSQIWDFTRSYDYYAGIFIWTGFDYRGEPTPFQWPSVSSQFGIMDTCGFAKASFYYNQACFTEKPMVHLIPHWNWTEGEAVRVVAITNCDEAELFLNGISLGRKMADACLQPEWQVEYVPGNIMVKVYRNGACVAKEIQYTTGKPVAVKAEAYRDYVCDDGQDVVILNCAVVDGNKREVATADNHLYFDIEGDGVLLGVGNGNPNSHESDVLPERDLFAGKCQAIIRVLPGAKTLRIRVYGEGLEEAIMEPEIRRVAVPKYMESVENHILYSITQSVITDKRPNPLIEIADNDMNTFAPVEFSWEHFQKDFTSGWRIYRITPVISENQMILELSAVRASSMEVYVNSKRIYANTDDIEGVVKCGFSAETGEKADIRILLKGMDREESGIKKCIQLYGGKQEDGI